MKKLIVALVLFALFLSGCSTSEKLDKESFVNSFKNAEMKTRRFTANDMVLEEGSEDIVKGVNLFFDAERFIRVNALEETNNELINKYFEELTNTIVEIINGLELTETEDQKHISQGMLWRVDVNIDQDAFIVYENGVVCIVKDDKYINYKTDEKTEAAFMELYKKVLNDISSFK